MNKSRKGLTVVLGILIIIAVPLVVLFTAPAAYTGLIERGVRSATGLTLELERMELDLFPPHLLVGDVIVRNPQLSYAKPLLELDQATVRVDAERLLERSPGWWSASTSGVRIKTGSDAQGRRLWPLPKGRQQQPDQKRGIDDSALFQFDRIEAADLTYQRVSAGETTSLEVAYLTLVKETPRRLHVDLDASYRDEPLTAVGTLALPGADSVQQVDLRGTVFGSDLKVTGTLGNDGRTRGRLRISAKAQDLNTLGELLDQRLARYAPLDLTLDLETTGADSWKLDAEGEIGGHRIDIGTGAKIRDRTLTLDALNAQIDETQVTGDVALNAADRELTAHLASPLLNLDPLLPVGSASADGEKTQKREPKPAPSDAGAVDLEPLRHWSIDVKIRIEELRHRAYAIKDLQMEAGTGPDTLSFDSSVATITANSDQAVAWQLTEPLTLDGTLALTGDNAGAVSLQLRGSGLNGGLDTNLTALAQGATQLDLQASLENFSSLQGIDPAPYQPFLPLSVSLQGRITGQQVRLDPLKVSTGDEDIAGSLEIDRAATPVRISGKLHGNKVDFNRIATTSVDTGNGEDNQKQDKGPVFGRQPIDWSWLEAATVDLDLQLDQLVFNQTTFRNVRTRIDLKDGRLSLDPIAANLSKGGVYSDLYIRQTRPGAAIDTRLVVTELMPADLGQPDKGLIDGGATDLLIDLKTQGSSPHQLVSQLNGNLALEVQRAEIRNKVFELIGSDILMQTLQLLNPFAKKDDTTDLECAAVHFKAKQGVLTSDNQLVVETSKMKIRGGGTINLAEETLQVDFAPSPRSGVGISAGDLASFVRLGGTLSDPQPEADPKGVAKSAATVGAAVATSGLSLLAQGLFNRLRNLGTACGRIFNEVTDLPETLRLNGAP